MADLGFAQSSLPIVITSDDDGILTYSAGITGLASATLATDIFTITGSATKTVKVLRIEISGTETTSTVRSILLIKRSTANSGGTSTTPTAVAHDSNNSSATATIRAYTANPTLGSTIGTVRVIKVDIESTNLVGSSDEATWDFGVRPSQPIYLRGTSEVLAVNLNGVTVPGSSFDINIEWTEE